MQRRFMLFSLAVLIGLAFVTTSFTQTVTKMYAQAQSQREGDMQQNPSRGSDMQQQGQDSINMNRESQPATPSGRMQGSPQDSMRSSGMQGNDIFATLTREHQQVKQILSQLQNTTDSSSRREMVRQLNIALFPHMKAEEKTLYKSLKDNSNTKDLAKQAQKEHDQAARALKDVNDSIDRSDFNANLSKLNQLIAAHVQREENQIFAAARNLDQTKLSEISTNYQQERQKIAQDTEKKQYEDMRGDTGRGTRGPGTTTGVTGGSGNGSGTRSR